MARDHTFKGQKIGDLLRIDALKRAYGSSSVIGSVAIVTDPKDDRAADFYARFGFDQLDEGRMILLMKTVPEWLGLPKAGD